MQRLTTGLALLTCCFLALTGCGEPKRIAVAIPIPAERMDCVAAGERPAIVPEAVIDWGLVMRAPSVQIAHQLAKEQFELYRDSVRTRERVITTYVLTVEGQLFACSNDAAWLREWSSKNK